MRTGADWLKAARRALADWRTQGGISRGIALPTLSLTAILTAGAGAITCVVLASVLRESIDNELELDNRLLRQNLETELDTIALDLATLAASPIMLATLEDPEKRAARLQSAIDTYVPPVPRFVALAVYDAQGTVVARNSPEAFPPGANVLEAAAAANGAAARVRPAPDGTRMLQLIFPLRTTNTESAQGMLVGMIDLDRLFGDATRLLSPQTSRRMLAADNADSVPAPVPPGFTVRTWRPALAPPLDELRLQVQIGQAESPMYVRMRNTALLFAAFTALALLAALYVIRHIARGLELPLNALRRTASAVAAGGSLDFKADVNGRREFALLAQAFNSMLDRMRDSQSQLLAHKSVFKTLIENSPDLIARFNRELRCIYVNPMVQVYFGVPPERVLNRSVDDLRIRKSVRQIMLRIFEQGGEQTYEYHVGNHHYETRFIGETGVDGRVASVVGIMRDVTARHAAEESLRMASRAIESSDSPILVTGCAQDDYPIRYVNPAFERVTGYSSDEALGRNCRFLQGDDRDQPALEVLRLALREEHEARVELRNYRKDGSLFWNELCISPVRDAKGAVTHFVGEIIDITARHEEQDQLQHLATHDPLTGLPNRNLLIDRLMQAISYAQRYQRMIAVAFLDLDKFKQINDSMGHDAGDELLKIVADRLSACVRDSDTVARLGGDEFVLVLYDQANEDITYHAMQRVLSSISQPMEVHGRELAVTCSIGFAVYPQDGEGAETLIKNADTAMYRAKELGRDNFQFYTEELHTRINERLAMETGLRRALEQQEFVLHYQPRINLGSGKMTGMEALIRWNHPELELIEPRRFVPLAEELGLIHEIGEWVLQQACRQQKTWHQKGVADLPMAVNISAAQFLQKDFTRLVAAVLRETGIDPARLELEISESLSMRDPDATIDVLRELKQMGIKVAIDDFGTGYSNLSYMKQFPVDTIKLDRSFVRDIVHNPEDLAISDAVISMAHSLHLKVTAEGVESATQLALLADRGCDDMQGFYFSPAMPVDGCTAILLENRTLAAAELGRSQSNRTLLLIDDEPHVLAALERVLRRTGCRILKAPSAIAAFDLMAMHEVGVILSDQRMPEMTGVEFFARIRHMYPATVRMILSGHADIDAVTNAINIGAVYKFLNKPWDANELCAIVDEAFDKYESDMQHPERIGMRGTTTC